MIMKYINSLSLRASALALLALTTLSGCSEIIIGELSDRELISYQAKQIVENTNSLFAEVKEVKDDDITKLIVIANGVKYISYDLDNVRAVTNQINFEAMSHLKVDREKGTITNQYGGDVRVMAKDGSFLLIYTGVPKHVDCSAIDNVACEHASEAIATGEPQGVEVTVRLSQLSTWMMFFGIWVLGWIFGMCTFAILASRKNREQIDTKN